MKSLEIFGLKIGNYICINEYMKICENTRTMSLFYLLTQDSQSITAPNISLKATVPIVTKCQIEPLWAEGTESPGHMANMAAMPIHGKKPLRIFFSRLP